MSSLAAYVEAQDRLDREAREMFPYDFSTCSVDEGYVKQQVFACLTCMRESHADHAGGVCYSCSITCHGEHDLVELFNRRAFKCDCGTPLVGQNACTITNTKRDSNLENEYNDNFKNIFCYCRVNYDPSTEDCVMFQCLLCENWFHDKCIRAEEDLPDEESFEHYICRSCADKVPWLCRYHDLYAAAISKSNIPDVHLDSNRQKRSFSQVEGLADQYGPSGPIAKQVRLAEPADKARVSSTQPSSREMLGERAVDSIERACRWAMLPNTTALKGRSIFLPEDFRDYFCRCSDCQTRLDSLPALAREEEVYDPPIDDDNESSYDAGTRALGATLQALPREQAIEGLLAFHSLKNHITDCLRPLVEKGETITSEHIRGFFKHE